MVSTLNTQRVKITLFVARFIAMEKMCIRVNVTRLAWWPGQRSHGAFVLILPDCTVLNKTNQNQN